MVNDNINNINSARQVAENHIKQVKDALEKVKKYQVVEEQLKQSRIQTNIANEQLKLNKKAILYSKIAILISIVAIIVSIVKK